MRAARLLVRESGVAHMVISQAGSSVKDITGATKSPSTLNVAPIQVITTTENNRGHLSIQGNDAFALKESQSSRITTA